MSFSLTKSFFTTGPFSEVGERMETFSSNIYYSYLFSEYVEQHKKLEEELKEAENSDNDEELLQKQTEMSYYEGIFNLSLSFNLFDELES